MKRNLFILSVLLLISAKIRAEIVLQGSLKYNVDVDADTAIVCGYSSIPNDGLLKIPDKIESSGKVYRVTTIKSYSLQDCMELTEIFIPASILYIEKLAFANCINLETLTFEDSKQLLNIDKSCLDNVPFTTIKIGRPISSAICKGNNKLRNVILGTSIKSIKEEEFFGCISLESINSQSIESIENSAFKNCSSLTMLKMSNLTTIKRSAFENCISLETVDLPNVTTIGNEAFYNCPKLSTIDLPKAIAIAPAAFASTGLKSVNIPSLRKIMERTFLHCVKLTDITYSNNLQKIGNGAFANCGFEYLKIPNSCKEIHDGAFSSCHNLKEIYLPDSCTSIGKGVFSDCSSLELIKLPNEMIEIREKLFSDCSKLKEIVLPSKLRFIKTNAFFNCNEIAYLDFSNTQLTSIDDFAFNSCSSLKKAVFPSTFCSIGKHAFKSCTALDEIIGLENVSYIEALAFDDTPWYNHNFTTNGNVIIGKTLYKHIGKFNGDKFVIPEKIVSISPTALKEQPFKTIVFPKSLKIIGNDALSNCVNLVALTIPEHVSTIGSQSGCTSLISLRVMSDSSTYKSDFSAFNDSPIKTLYLGRNTYSFIETTSLERITISKWVKSLKSNCFSKCKNLTDLEIEDSTEPIDLCDLLMTNVKNLYLGRDIANYKYNNSNNFRSIENLSMSKLVTRIPEYLFSGAKNLKRIKLHDGLQAIGSCAFENCGIEELVIPNSIISLGITKENEILNGSPAFSNNPLKKLVIGKGLTIIPGWTFVNHQLDTLEIPSNIKFVGENAFLSNSAKTVKLILHEGLKRIWEGAFAFKTDSVIIPSTVDGNIFGMMPSFNCKYAEIRSKVLPGFFQSTGIENIVLSDNVEEICENALWSCRKLKKIVLPKNLKTIRSGAFGETSLKELIIPSSVEKIEDGYIRGTDNPIKITVEGNKDSKSLDLPSSKETTLLLKRNIVYKNEDWSSEQGYLPDTLIIGTNVTSFNVQKTSNNGAKVIFCLNNEFNVSSMKSE